MDRCILAATDGEAQAIGALRCAKDIAVRAGLPLEIVSVCELPAGFGAGPDQLLAGLQLDPGEACRRRRRAEATEQLGRAGIHCTPFISVEFGSPPREIARAAERRGARMVVVGRGRRGLDRLLTDEAAMHLIQASHTPILSVPQSYAELPRRALAAVDFTSFSVDAAREALALLPHGGELHLAHVLAEQTGQGLGSRRSSAWDDALEGDARQRLRATAAELERAAPGITVTTHLLEGRPVHALLRLAESLGVDLMAAGTNGYGLLGRLLMGSVATQLVRRSQVPILVAPSRGSRPRVRRFDDLRRSRPAVVREACAAITERAS